VITWCNHPECEQYGHANCQLQGTEDQQSGLAEGADQPAVSDPDEKLDKLVQQASRPSLAELYKRAKAKGLTLTQSAYQ
jgi:hypothetical protein